MRLWQIKKILTRNLRRDLREPLQRIAENLGKFDFKEWTDSIHHSANRLGLLLCQEPNAALTGIALYPQNTHPETNQIPFPNVENAPAEDRGNWLRQNQEAGQLIQYAISDEYLNVRRRLGLSLPEY